MSRSSAPLSTIWERYFLKELFKVFALFLFGFYTLYVLIDYSNHAASFKHYNFHFIDVAKYYGYEFVTRMPILVPFAIVIACVKVLCGLNTNNELVALMASGIKLKRILLPFIVFGLLFTGLMYFNAEVLQPMAQKYNTKLDHSRAKAKQKKTRSAQSVRLEDRTALVYQSYDSDQEIFTDAFWIKSFEEIYRIRTLYPTATPPLGKEVEHLQRDAEGNLVLAESQAEMQFPDMVFNQEKLLESVSSGEAHSLSSLNEIIPEHNAPLSEKEAQLVTSFHYKLALPWLCLLAIIAPAPLCIRFTRSLPVFLIYALSIFGLVAFYLVMESAVVLGERQMFSPAVAIWTPFTLFFSFFSWRYFKKD